jgi:outer membrane immunogenic protein
MSRRGLLSGCALPAMLLALSTASRAADVGPAPAHDWNGLYVGGFLGYGDIESNGFFATSLDLGFGGGSSLAGGRVGWNWQFGSLLFGVENDFSFFKFEDENLREETYQASADFLGTLRGRVGWADDNVLFYATGGAAFLHGEVRTSLGALDEDQIDNEDAKDL